MVAHLLKLKLDLLRNSLKRSVWQLVGLILAGLYGLGVLGLALAGLVVLGTQQPAMVGTVVTLAGAALFIGWLVVPVLASGLDMTLDPERFTTYAIPERSMLTGLALSGFIGVPGAITLLASVGTAAAWWQRPGVAAVALACGALAALSCILASRAITAASTSLASSRRFKDVSGMLLLVPLVLMGPIITAVTDGVTGARDYLPSLAQTLSWTPLGAIWAVPADLAAGRPAAAGAKFLIALATMAALAWIWKVCLARALVTPAHTGSTRRGGGRLGFFDRFPGTPAGAVAARCLSYWFRDPRYSAGLVIAPLLPLVFLLAGSQAGGPAAAGWILGFGGAFTAFVVSWSISSDISYDNTAFALHVATGVSGRADRTGRALAAGVLALPLGLVFAVVGSLLTGEAWLLPATVGLVLTAVGGGLGMSSVFSARFTMNVPLPGDSPLKSRPGNNLSAMLVQLVGFFGSAVLTVPILVPAAIAAAPGTHWIAWTLLPAGAVLGTLYLLAGIRIGAREYDLRAPELLLAVSADR